VSLEPWAPRDDYFGLKRGLLPAMGAVERGVGSIQLKPKR
jgi:hypothetical protein